jgi:hypothetical protein
MKTDVTNTPAARKLLMTHGLILPSASNMLEAISVALFKFSITANLGAMHTDIIRALALMIHDVNSDLDTENVISTIKTFLGGPITTLDEKVDQFKDTVKVHKETTEKTIEEVHNKLDKSTEKLGNMVEKVEALTANCVQTRNGVKGSDRPKTYASAAKTNIPTALSKIIAKNKAQARQILIDRWSPIHVNSLCCRDSSLYSTYRPYRKTLYWTCCSAGIFAFLCISHFRIFRIFRCLTHFAIPHISHFPYSHILRVSHFCILALFTL